MNARNPSRTALSTLLSRKIAIWAGAAVLFISGFALGTTHTSTVQAQRGNPGDSTAFETFWDVWNIIHDDYVDAATIDDKALIEGAMTGLVAALGDQHSAYMSPVLYARLSDESQGTYEGIGASVRKDEATGGLSIVSTTAGSPARAVLKVGDVIVLVNGENITRLTETQIINKVRGITGTTVILGVLRQGERQILDIIVKRATIDSARVTAAIYDGNIGYVSLANFSDGADNELALALRRIKADSLNGLILDLRGDPGGGLQTAINIASLFIEEGPVVIQRNKPGVEDVPFRASGNVIAGNVPMVLLVNSASASASELIAGAMRDYKRATIVGTTTFGKGSVQTWQGLADGGGIRITTAHFLSPLGGEIDKIGIVPDVYVAWDYDAQPEYDPQLAEAIAILRGAGF